MNQYLAKLKKLETEKNFNNSTEIKLTKPPKAPYVSFVGSVSEENEKISAIQSFEIETIRAWLFRINEPIEDHDVVLSKCQSDPEAMAYFLKHAQGEFDEK